MDKQKLEDLKKEIELVDEAVRIINNFHVKLYKNLNEGRLEGLKTEIELMDKALRIVHDFHSKLYKNLNEMLNSFSESKQAEEKPKKKK